MRLNFFYRSAVAPGVLAVAVLATACGGGSSPSTAPRAKTAAEVLPAMQKAVKTATSVHMVGSAVSGGQKITFDMSFYGKAEMSGTFGEGGGSVLLMVVGRNTYFKLDAGFLKMSKLPAAECSLICGKYLEEPGTANQVTGDMSMTSLSSQLFGELPASVTKDKSKLFVPAKLGGQSVLQFRGGGYTIDVAASGTPYPVMVADSSGDNVTFSEWNSVQPSSAPPAGAVVNLSQLSKL
jgi:hypothetical protein